MPSTQESQNGLNKFGKELRSEFLFDPKYRNLNHGSFGTYPRALRPILHKYQDAAEARPDDFLLYQYPALLDLSRKALAKYLNAPSETIVLVSNATTGVNTVLRGLVFEPGDLVLYTSSIYGACQKTIEYICETTPAESTCVEYVMPIEDDWLVEQFRAKIEAAKSEGKRVKVAVFDTVVSMPGVRLPFERLTALCKELGVLSLIDGAHGIGHVELDLGGLDPDFFVSNCHKWLHNPRGCAVFYVPVRNQPLIRSTLPTSHGFLPRPVPGEEKKINNPIPVIGAKSPWVANFEFVGTIDNSPYLCIPEALKWRASIGGEKAIIQYNQQLAKAAAKRTAEILGTDYMDNSTGTLTNCCLSNTRIPLDLKEVEAVAAKVGVPKEDVGPLVNSWMRQVFLKDYDTFICTIFYHGKWYARWSGQVYLELADFEWAANALKEVCARVLRGEFAPETEKPRL